MPTLHRTIPALVAVFACLSTAAPDQGCPPGKQLILLQCTDTAAFAICSGLEADMTAPFEEIGYCLRPYTAENIALTGQDSADNFIILVRTAGSADSLSDKAAPVVVGLVRTGHRTDDDIANAFSHPLVTLDYLPDDPATFRAVLVRKIIENMRTSYVCHLAVQTEPEGAQITTRSGLSAQTPVEWIVPTGPFEITITKHDFLPFRKKIDLQTPGYNQMHFQLVKRRFYHSKWLYGTLACTAIAGACYGLEQYYYSRYQSLGKDEYEANPEEFGRTFDTARAFEIGTGAALAAAGVTLVLTLWF